jgi:hypothetical protein
MKKSEKIKIKFKPLSGENFGKGFNSSFSIKFYIFKKKFSLHGVHAKSPFFPIFLPLHALVDVFSSTFLTVFCGIDTHFFRSFWVP